MGPFSDGWNETDVEAVIEHGDPRELLYVPIVVGMNAAACDRDWAESICLGLAEHPDFTVRGNAILGLSHIARTCRALNLAKAIPAIQRALSDQNPYVRGHAKDVASDLKVFLGVTVQSEDKAK
jgi:hypothetical protein